jgi:hypothetical protein
MRFRAIGADLSCVSGLVAALVAGLLGHDCVLGGAQRPRLTRKSRQANAIAQLPLTLLCFSPFARIVQLIAGVGGRAGPRIEADGGHQ